MSDKVQYHAIVHGRVQGVFFRAETAKAAGKFNITGWVRNLTDGSVETVIEGEETNVQQMIQWIETGPPLASVADVQWEKNLSPSGFTDFTIKR